MSSSEDTSLNRSSSASGILGRPSGNRSKGFEAVYLISSSRVRLLICPRASTAANTANRQTTANVILDILMPISLFGILAGIVPAPASSEYTPTPGRLAPAPGIWRQEFLRILVVQIRVL